MSKAKKSIQKNVREIVYVNNPESIISIVNAVLDSPRSGRGNLNDISIIDIGGWVLQTSLTSTVQIVLTDGNDSMFIPLSITRPDVVKHHNVSSEFAKCGFLYSHKFKLSSKKITLAIRIDEVQTDWVEIVLEN